MKRTEKTIIVYTCDYCPKEFPTEEACLEHELHTHKCPFCKHQFFLFGSEEMCDLASGCIFEEKDHS